MGLYWADKFPVHFGSSRDPSAVYIRMHAAAPPQVIIVLSLSLSPPHSSDDVALNALLYRCQLSFCKFC